MLLYALLKAVIVSSAVCIEESNRERKPYIVFPVPFDLPSRNDRATQCWLRIEDEELIETVAVYCHIAQEFVRKHIHEYNSRKMTEDDVDVSLWSEEPQSLGDVLKVPESSHKNIKHWKTTTILDPVTRMRLSCTFKMLLGVSLEIALIAIMIRRGTTAAAEPKPYAIFPVPFELPNRNDRSNQCWLRIEDLELVDTVTVYCFVAQAFLRNHIRDYNARKMKEDGVDMSLWSEEASPRYETDMKAVSDPKNIKDWRGTTVFDPTVNRRIYVTKDAECKLIMYSREGMTNYKETELELVGSHYALPPS
ncbi:unnamed protein product, partial [Iphiclides podalirius]